MNDSGALAWQVAEVLESGDAQVRLRFLPTQSCSRCSTGRGCGAGVFSALFSSRPAEVDMPREMNLVPGQRVRVGISTQALLLSAGCAYGLPLIGFLAGALPAYWWIEPPLWRDLLSLFGGMGVAVMAWRVGGALARFGRPPVIEPLSCGSHATKS